MPELGLLADMGEARWTTAPRKQLPVVAQEPVAQHEPPPLVAFDIIGPFEEPALSSRARTPSARAARAPSRRRRGRASRRHSPGPRARASRRRRDHRPWRGPGAWPRISAAAASSHHWGTGAAAAKCCNGCRAWPHHSSQLRRRHEPPPPGDTRPEPPTRAAVAARSAPHGYRISHRRAASPPRPASRGEEGSAAGKKDVDWCRWVSLEEDPADIGISLGPVILQRPVRAWGGTRPPDPPLIGSDKGQSDFWGSSLVLSWSFQRSGRTGECGMPGQSDRRLAAVSAIHFSLCACHCHVTPSHHSSHHPFPPSWIGGWYQLLHLFYHLLNELRKKGRSLVFTSLFSFFIGWQLCHSRGGEAGQ